ncbi:MULTISPECIES: hypothetical protein [unclassified Okeania]|uniref:hypothetical protein n=1 Tax=unclassified Okeania TaxID=2634635 RepID=UPI00257C75F1|nr:MULTISPECIES: hypothetical protein [unclassified Okeania]
MRVKEKFLDVSLLLYGYLPSTMATAINLITTEVAKWIVQRCGVEMPNFTTLAGKVITFN